MRTTDKTRLSEGEVMSLESPGFLDYARYELSHSRQIQVRISGSSMRPTLDEGDIVTIAPTGRIPPNPQDIVLIATLSRTALIHRAVSLQTGDGSSRIVTRGDHARFVDTPVPLSQILGRVASVQRKGRGKNVPLRHRPSLLDRLRMWVIRLFT